MIRTVSMLPAATEIVGALGLMDQLLAVSHECDFPDEANRRPRVTFCEIYGKGLSSAEIDRWVSERLQSHGSLYTLDEQTLRTLEPDLILTQRLCDVCAPAYDSVEEMAKHLPTKPRVLSLEPKCLADILSNISEVATAMGQPRRAEEVRRRLEKRIADVKPRVEGLDRRGTFIMEWAEPIFNSGHWNPELIDLARGIPLLSQKGEYSVRVAWETLRSADPEVLIIACCGHAVERTKSDIPILEKLPGWEKMNAVQNRRVYIVDGSAYFSRPGPRIVDALEMIAWMIHPESLPKLDAESGIERVY